MELRTGSVYNAGATQTFGKKSKAEAQALTPEKHGISKKAAIIAGTAALALAATTIVYAIKKPQKISQELPGEVQKLQEEIKTMMSEADTIQKKTAGMLNDTQKLFMQGGKNKEGAILATITEGEDGAYFMQQTLADGTVRKSEFLNKQILKISDTLSDGKEVVVKRNICNGGKGVYMTYDEIAEKTLQQTVFDKRLLWEDGICSYKKGVEQNADGIGSTKTAQSLRIRKGQPDYYIKGDKTGAYAKNARFATDQCLKFKNGRPVWYGEGEIAQGNKAATYSKTIKL